MLNFEHFSYKILQNNLNTPKMPYLSFSMHTNFLIRKKVKLNTCNNIPIITVSITMTKYYLQNGGLKMHFVEI